MSAVNLSAPNRGQSIKDWNEQRRKEIASKRRTSIHRTMIDELSKTYKVNIPRKID